MRYTNQSPPCLKGDGGDSRQGDSFHHISPTNFNISVSAKNRLCKKATPQSRFLYFDRFEIFPFYLHLKHYFNRRVLLLCFCYGKCFKNYVWYIELRHEKLIVICPRQIFNCCHLFSAHQTLL